MQTEASAAEAGDDFADLAELASQENSEFCEAAQSEEQLASTVPKAASGSSSGSSVRQRAERKKQQQQQQQQLQQKQQQHQKQQQQPQQQRRHSIFTLDKVRRIFTDKQEPQQQQQQQQRRASLASVDQLRAQQQQRRASTVSVDHLPARCLVKYLGEEAASGVTGRHCVREAVDELVRAAAERKRRDGQSLSVAKLEISEQGVRFKAHPSCPSDSVPARHFGLNEVSYAVADSRLERVFCFVTLEVGEAVDAVSSSSRRPRCHAFLCDTPEDAHRCVLAVSAAFESLAPAKSPTQEASHASQRQLRVSTSSYDC